MIERYVNAGVEVAIIVHADTDADGVEFLTEDGDFLQMGLIGRPAEFVVPTHRHLGIRRTVDRVCEALFVVSGKVEASLYDDEGVFLGKSEMEAGAVILQLTGYHGFRMMEDSKIIEIKQGPYYENFDKVEMEKD